MHFATAWKKKKKSGCSLTERVFSRVYFDARSDFRTMWSFYSTVVLSCFQSDTLLAYSLPLSRDWYRQKNIRLSLSTGSSQFTSFSPNYSIYNFYKCPYQYKIKKITNYNGGIVRVFILVLIVLITYTELQVIKPQALWYHAWILIISFITFFLCFLRGDNLPKCIFNMYLLQVKLPPKYWTFISTSGSEFKRTDYK